MTSSLLLCFLLTVTADIHEDHGEIWQNLIHLSDPQNDGETYTKIWYITRIVTPHQK